MLFIYEEVFQFQKSHERFIQDYIA